jgi:hypothetical protein
MIPAQELLHEYKDFRTIVSEYAQHAADGWHDVTDREALMYPAFWQDFGKSMEHQGGACPQGTPKQCNIQIDA